MWIPLTTIPLLSVMLIRLTVFLLFRSRRKSFAFLYITLGTWYNTWANTEVVLPGQIQTYCPSLGTWVGFFFSFFFLFSFLFVSFLLFLDSLLTLKIIHSKCCLVKSGSQSHTGFLQQMCLSSFQLPQYWRGTFEAQEYSLTLITTKTLEGNTPFPARCITRDFISLPGSFTPSAQIEI